VAEPEPLVAPAVLDAAELLLAPPAAELATVVAEPAADVVPAPPVAEVPEPPADPLEQASSATGNAARPARPASPFRMARRFSSGDAPLTSGCFESM
jgi:hypothetical protein